MNAVPIVDREDVGSVSLIWNREIISKYMFIGIVVNFAQIKKSYVYDAQYHSFQTIPKNIRKQDWINQGNK